MKLFTTSKRFALVFALAICCRAFADGETNAVALVTSRDFYNAGTKLLDNDIVFLDKFVDYLNGTSHL